MVRAYSWNLKVESILHKIHKLKLEDELVTTEESTYHLLGEDCLSVEQQS